MDELSNIDPISNLVIHCDDLTLTFLDNKKSSFYMLPVTFAEGHLYGYLRGENSLTPVKVGMRIHNKDRGGKFYLHFGEDLGSESSANPRDDVLYVTGWGSELSLNVGVGQFGKIVRPISVEGKQGVFAPLIFALAKCDKLSLHGIYFDSFGRYGIQDYPISSPEHGELLKALLRSNGFALGKPLGKYAFFTHQASFLSNTKTVAAAGKDIAQIVDGKTSAVIPEIDWSSPQSIVAYLDRFVIGQRSAKIMAATAFSSYMTKVVANDQELPRDNIFLAGSSGVGKTLIFTLLARAAKLAYAETKLTGKSSEGYKGRNLSQVFDSIRNQTADEAPYGVVFLDEIDKLAVGDSNDFFGLRLQDEIIGWSEEETIMDQESQKKDPSAKPKPPLNTKNLLFVVAGAFQNNGSGSLLEIVGKRLSKGIEKIGFQLAKGGSERVDKKSVTFGDVTPEDLMAYGLKPELIGRFPVVVTFDDLTLKDKVEILKKAENSCLAKYQKLLKVKGFSLNVTDDALEVIANQCPPETGARALNSICSAIFYKILFDPTLYSHKVGSEDQIELTGEIIKALLSRSVTEKCVPVPSTVAA